PSAPPRSSAPCARTKREPPACERGAAEWPCPSRDTARVRPCSLVVGIHASDGPVLGKAIPRRLAKRVGRCFGRQPRRCSGRRGKGGALWRNQGGGRAAGPDGGHSPKRTAFPA